MEFAHHKLEPGYIKESEVVRNLVLIGNGFDLSHGLKTSYKDFFEFIVKRYLSSHNPIIGRKNIMDTINYDNFEIIKENIDKLKSDNDLLLHLINKIGISERWVDIEWIYYQLLIELLKADSDQKIITRITKYNKDLENIKILLKEFIEDYIVPKISGLQLRDSIVDGIFGQKRDFNDILCLNFNYTHTPTIYKSPHSGYEFRMIQIHGTYKDKIDDIIFGFGDDNHPKYPEIENRNINELFRNFKSFKYLRRDRYHELIKWIGEKSEENKFVVTILGHSCGITDRTLLRYIFEHENCETIIPFYHFWTEKNEKNETIARDNYTDISYEISRQFTNNIVFRNKMKNFEECRSI